MPFHPGDHVVDHVDDALHHLLPESDKHYVFAHAADCPICSIAMREARTRFAALQKLPTISAGPRLINATLHRVHVVAGEFSARALLIRRWTLRAVAAAILLMVGYHLYIANSGPSAYDLRLLGQQQFLAGAPAAIRAQLVKNAQPVAGAHITLALVDTRAANTVQLASYTTDTAGTGSPRFTLPDWPDGQYTLRARASVGMYSESLDQPVSLRRESRLLLSADKPVYQPGQTLHARVLALRRPDLKPVAAREALFTLTDPRGNIVFKAPGVTSPFGIASVDCPTDPEILQGTYTLTCRVDATESSRTLEIKHYTLPKFKIALTTDKPFYAPGDRVRATVKADYFFNQPVAAAVVSLTSAGAVPLPAANISARTDANGRATLEFILPPSLSTSPTNDADAAAHLTLTATVRDSGAQEQSRTLSLVVSNSPLHIELLPESGTLVKGLPNHIFALTTYPDGRPAKTRLSVAGLDQPFNTSALGVARFDFTPHADQTSLTLTAADDQGLTATRRFDLATGDQDDYLVRTDKAVYRVGDTLTVDILGGGNEPVFVDLLKDGQTLLTSAIPVKNGHGNLPIDLAPELAGTLELAAYRFADTGLAVRKTRLLYVQTANDLQIHTALDQKEYRPGASARLSLRLTNSSGKAAPGAISLAAVDEAVFSVLDQTPGAEKTFFTLDQQRLQSAYTLYPGFNPSSADADQALLTQALFSKAAGATLDRNAILARLVRQGDISQRMLRSLNTEWGRRTFREMIEQSDLPNAQKQLLLDNGAFSLEASTGPANRLRAERLAQTRREWLPALWGLVIIASISALLFVFARSQFMAFLVIILISGCLISILLPSLGKARELSNRSVAAAEARGIAQALQVDDTLRVATPPGDAGTQPPRLRQYFPETLLWRPELITDDQGNASLDIPLADAITTWRLSTSAVTATGQLGSTDASIRVFQPFFVDLDLPATLTANDEISLPATLYNYLPTTQTVSVSLTQADWFEFLDDRSHTLELQPGDVKPVYFRIRVLKPGSHALQLTATGAGNVGDAIQRDLTILPEGHPIEHAASGILSADPVTIPLSLPQNITTGSLRVTAKIYPSTFSQVAEGLDAIFQAPSGCFEQTSSTTYPNVLALDYLKQTRRAVPDVEARARSYIHLGYQRLLTFEIPGGGFDWFGNPPAHATLTAYGLMEFQDMAAVYNVDPKLLDRTRKWLLARQRPEGSWPAPDRQFYHDDPTALGDAGLSTTAYIAWSLFSGVPDPAAKSTQKYLHANAAAARSNPYTAALVANALLAIDPADAVASDLLASLESAALRSPDRKRASWSPAAGRHTSFYGAGKSAEVETTALAALAMLKARGHGETANAALTWIVAAKDANGTWYSTQATVLALKALLAGTSTPSGNVEERALALELDGKIIHEWRIPAAQSDVVASLDLTPFLSPDAPGSLRILPRNSHDVSYQIVTRYNLPGPPPTAPGGPLSVHVAYDRSTLAVNQDLHAIAELKNASADPLPMIMLDLPIPPGFAVDPGRFDMLQSNGTIEKYQVTSRQVIIYLRALNPGQSLSLPYTLRPRMAVKVAVPAARAYEYYKPENHAKSAPATLTVTAAKSL